MQEGRWHAAARALKRERTQLTRNSRVCRCMRVCALCDVYLVLVVVQANKIRDRKKELMRLQKKAVEAGLLPKATNSQRYSP